MPGLPFLFFGWAGSPNTLIPTSLLEDLEMDLVSSLVCG